MFLFAVLDSCAVFCQDRNYLQEKVAAVFMKKFKLLRYIILKATIEALLWKLADMNFWPQFLKITYGGVWSFPKSFSVILSTTFAKVFCGTAIFGIIASKAYHCYIIMIHIQFCFAFSFFYILHWSYIFLNLYASLPKRYYCLTLSLPTCIWVSNSRKPIVLG